MNGKIVSAHPFANRICPSLVGARRPPLRVQQLAVRAEIPLAVLCDTVQAFPTYSEIYQHCSPTNVRNS